MYLYYPVDEQINRKKITLFWRWRFDDAAVYWFVVSVTVCHSQTGTNKISSLVIFMKYTN